MELFAAGVSGKKKKRQQRSEARVQAAQDTDTLRISLDTKAKVKIGEFSRGGVARGRDHVHAADHDMHPDAVLAPTGILEVNSNRLNIVFGTSRDTSDFVADCLKLWWTNRSYGGPTAKRLYVRPIRRAFSRINGRADSMISRTSS